MLTFSGTTRPSFVRLVGLLSVFVAGSIGCFQLNPYVGVTVVASVSALLLVVVSGVVVVALAVFESE